MSIVISKQERGIDLDATRQSLEALEDYMIQNHLDFLKEQGREVGTHMEFKSMIENKRFIFIEEVFKNSNIVDVNINRKGHICLIQNLSKSYFYDFEIDGIVKKHEQEELDEQFISEIFECGFVKESREELNGNISNMLFSLNKQY